jgi:hypothetical protein
MTEAALPDFLTRLVAATYQPAVVMRPRPVAHYESIGAALPLWPAGEATPTSSAVTPSRQAPIRPTSASSEAPPPLSGAPSSSALHSQPLNDAERLTPPNPTPPNPTTSNPTTSNPTTPHVAHTLSSPQSAPLPRSAIQPATQTSPHTPPLTSTSPVQTIAQPAVRSPNPPSHALPTPLLQSGREGQPGSENASERAEKPRTTPTPAQGVVTSSLTYPVPKQVVAEPGATQMQRSLPTVYGSSPGAEPVSMPRTSLAAAQSTALLQVSQPIALDDASSPASDRMRPPDAGAPRSQPSLNASRPASSVTVTPPVAPPPPIIRVTIGRIVIKADDGKPARPAKSHPVQAKPGLSLDAYLNSRRDGDA